MVRGVVERALVERVGGELPADKDEEVEPDAAPASRQGLDAPTRATTRDPVTARAPQG